MLKRVVDGLEVVALLAAAVAVVLMLAYRPAGGTKPNTAYDPQLATGQAVFTANCTGCHGANGEGVTGPRLAGGAVRRSYPNEADEVFVVTNGIDGMPSWKSKLTPAQIRAVVRYTRALP